MAIEQADNVQTGAPKPTDSRYYNNLSPWADVTAANAGVTAGVRYTGLTVNIVGTEYWYCGGIGDSNLCEKTTGGGGTLNMSGSTANGLTTYVDGTTICAESGLTYNSTCLSVKSQSASSDSIVVVNSEDTDNLLRVRENSGRNAQFNLYDRDAVPQIQFTASGSSHICGGGFKLGGIAAQSTETNILYVASDGTVASGATSGGGTVTGATNGLTLSGAEIILGGELTGNTSVGIDTYTFNICNGNAVKYDATNSSIFGIATQSDGKVLIGGSHTTYSGITSCGVTRLNLDGSLDNSFDVGSATSVNTIGVQSDGSIIAGGNFTTWSGQSCNRLMRLCSDGSIHPDWSIGTGFDSSICCVKILDDDKILVGGDFTTWSGLGYSKFMKLCCDGNRDTAFEVGSGFDSTVMSINTTATGSILVGGYFTTYSGATHNYLIKLCSDGAIDPNFEDYSVSGFSINLSAAFIMDAVELPDNNLAVVGSFDDFSGVTTNAIVGLTSTGRYNPTFDVGVGLSSTGAGRELCVESNKLYVGGDMLTYSGGSVGRALIRLNYTDASLDTSFDIGTGFNNDIFSLGFDSYGNILAGGQFTSFDGDSNIIRFAGIKSNGDILTGIANDFTYTNDTFTAPNISTGGLEITAVPAQSTETNILYIAADGIVASGVTSSGGIAVSGTTDNAVITYINATGDVCAEPNLKWNGTCLNLDTADSCILFSSGTGLICSAGVAALRGETGSRLQYGGTFTLTTTSTGTLTNGDSTYCRGANRQICMLPVTTDVVANCLSIKGQCRTGFGANATAGILNLRGGTSHNSSSPAIGGATWVNGGYACSVSSSDGGAIAICGGDACVTGTGSACGGDVFVMGGVGTGTGTLCCGCVVLGHGSTTKLNTTTWGVCTVGVHCASTCFSSVCVVGVTATRTPLSCFTWGCATGGDKMGIGAGETAGQMISNVPAGETLWLGGEQGVKIVSSPDNWATSWAGRNESTLVDTAGNSTFSKTGTDTAVLCAVNSNGFGTSFLDGAVVAEFIGDSDSLQIINEGAGDYFIGNPGQYNGISIKDGTGGIKLVYNGSDVLAADSTGGIEVTGRVCASTCTQSPVVCATTCVGITGNIRFSQGLGRCIIVDEATDGGNGDCLDIRAGIGDSDISPGIGGYAILRGGNAGCQTSTGTGVLGGYVFLTGGIGGASNSGAGGQGGRAILRGGIGGTSAGLSAGGQGGNIEICGGACGGGTIGGTGGHVFICSGNGSTDGCVMLYHDTTKRLHTTTTGTYITGVECVTTCVKTPYICTAAIFGATCINLCGGSFIGMRVYGTNNYLNYNGGTELYTHSGGICVPARGYAIDWVATSDCRLKDCIVPITNALSKIDCLCGRCYEWCADGCPDMGLIAQEVEKVEPILVTYSDTKHEESKDNEFETVLSLKYDKFAGLFVEAIKELKQQNECLQKQINELK